MILEPGARNGCVPGLAHARSSGKKLGRLSTAATRAEVRARCSMMVSAGAESRAIRGLRRSGRLTHLCSPKVTQAF
jgi:hypothetical protein